MLLAKLFRLLKSFLPLIPLCSCLYLIIIYSDSFWTIIAGLGHLIISILWGLSSLFCLYNSYALYKKKNNRTQGNFVFSMLLTISFGLILIYFTTSQKRLEYIYRMRTYMSLDSSEYLKNIFNTVYPAVHIQDFFIYRRTLEVHDILLAILLIWIVLTVVCEKYSDTIIIFLGEDILPNSIMGNNDDKQEEEKSQHISPQNTEQEVKIEQTEEKTEEVNEKQPEEESVNEEEEEAKEETPQKPPKIITKNIDESDDDIIINQWAGGSPEDKKSPSDKKSPVGNKSPTDTKTPTRTRRTGNNTPTPTSATQQQPSFATDSEEKKTPAKKKSDEISFATDSEQKKSDELIFGPDTPKSKDDDHISFASSSEEKPQPLKSDKIDFASSTESSGVLLFESDHKPKPAPKKQPPPPKPMAVIDEESDSFAALLEDTAPKKQSKPSPSRAQPKSNAQTMRQLDFESEGDSLFAGLSFD